MDLWLNMLVVLVVPLLAISNRGRNWFVRRPASDGIWIVSSALAVLGTVGAQVYFQSPIRQSAIAISTTPLIQSIIFTFSDRLFLVIFDRPPLSFNRAKFEKRADGTYYWADKVFWILMFLGLIGIGVIVPSIYGIELPSREYNR